jgi:hypothetical protein
MQNAEGKMQNYGIAFGDEYKINAFKNIIICFFQMLFYK